MTTPRPGSRVDVRASVPDEDARAIADLLTAADAADGYPSISEHARLDVEPGADVARSSEDQTRSLLLRADGPQEPPLLGYGILEHQRGRWTLEMVVHPLGRDGTHAVERDLFESALDHAARAGGGPLSVWMRSGTGDEPTWLSSRGFASVRQLVQLRAPLPIDEARRTQERPLDVRPFHPGRDEEAWLEVNRRAFAQHPEQGSWTRADLERREQASWFDPGGFLIHEVDHRIAGFCWTKVHRTPVMGEIYVIGVDPDFQGRGLGRALTVAGLDHLATRGVPEAMLYVEETNIAAMALYRSLGFTEDHRETVYAAQPAPAAEPEPAAPGALGS